MKKIKQATTINNNFITAYKNNTSKTYLYVIGGVHGDEVEGVHLAFEYNKFLLKNFNHLPIIFIPCLNPDGQSLNTRVNANLVDLNRNLPTKNWSASFKETQYNPGKAPGSEIENQFLMDILEHYPPAFIFSFHSYKPMVNYNGDCQSIAQIICEYNEYELVDDIGYPTPGSLGYFAPEKYQSPVITFECGRLKNGFTLLENLNKNKPWFDETTKFIEKNYF